MTKPLQRVYADIGPSRVEAVAPRDFRMAVYPDKSIRVQGAYAWSQGKDGGVTWKDLPLVHVSNDGQELYK